MENGPSEDACHFLLKMGMFHCYVSLPEGTLPETNIAPENGWLEYDLHFGMAYFQVLC